MSKHKNNTCKQGFLWRYRYTIDSQRKSIFSADLRRLQKKVEAQGLPWEIVDEEKAEKSLEENYQYEYKGNSRNTTGFYRVSKEKANTCKQGFIWRYIYSVDSQRKSIASTDLRKLQKKVEAQGLPWEILDEEKADKTKKMNRQ